MGRRSATTSLAVAILLLITACSDAADDDVELSDAEQGYLTGVESVEDQFGQGFEAIADATSRVYPTREVLFAAVRDAGFTGLASTALTRAESMTPPSSFEDDHDTWLDFRATVVDLGDELEAALDAKDMQELLAVMTTLQQSVARVLGSTSRPFCLSMTLDPDLCDPPDDLPGGDYGSEVYELLRRNALSTLGLFDFIADMSPEERAIRLTQVQPTIEESLSSTGSSLEGIEPPGQFSDDHAVLVEFFEDQYATAVAITEAAAAGDNAIVIQLFERSGANYQLMSDALSADFEPIAAPLLLD